MKEEDLRKLSIEELNEKYNLRNLNAKDVAKLGGKGSRESKWYAENREDLLEWASKGGKAYKEKFDLLKKTDPQAYEEYTKNQIAGAKKWLKENPEGVKRISTLGVEGMKKKSKIKRTEKFSHICEHLPDKAFTAKQLGEIQNQLGYPSKPYIKQMIEEGYLVLHHEGTNGSHTDVPLYKKL